MKLYLLIFTLLPLMNSFTLSPESRILFNKTNEGNISLTYSTYLDGTKSKFYGVLKGKLEFIDERPIPENINSAS